MSLFRRGRNRQPASDVGNPPPGPAPVETPASPGEPPEAPEPAPAPPPPPDASEERRKELDAREEALRDQEQDLQARMERQKQVDAREQAVQEQENLLRERLERVKQQEEAARSKAARVSDLLSDAERINAEARAREKPPPATPAAPPASAPASPPAQPTTVRGVPDRWKGIAAEDRVVIEDGSPLAADVESMLLSGKRPSELIAELGLPPNRFTHDQLRKYYLRAANTGGRQPAAGSTGSFEDELKRIELWRKAGLVYSRDDVDKLVDKAIERAGGLRETREGDDLAGLDGDARANVLMAKEVRALGMEVIDAARAVTGHPKIGSEVAKELRERRPPGDRPPLPTRRIPELPPGTVRSPEPIAPGAAGPTGAPPGPQNPPLPKVSIETEHPEFWPALDRIIELSPRIYEFIQQRQAGLSKNQVLENVQRDASLGAIAAWRMSSKNKPSHDWGPENTCVRCGTPRSPETVGKVCNRGLSQHDMLRRLYGLSVAQLIELVARYQGAIEFTSPLDSLGGMSVQELMMRKRWNPDDRINLGGGTIYGTVLQTDEGLTWLGTFLGRLREEIDKEAERPAGEKSEERKEPAPRGPAAPPAGGPAAPNPAMPGQGPQDDIVTEGGRVVVRRTVDMPQEGQPAG